MAKLKTTTRHLLTYFKKINTGRSKYSRRAAFNALKEQRSMGIGGKKYAQKARKRNIADTRSDKRRELLKKAK